MPGASLFSDLLTYLYRQESHATSWFAKPVQVFQTTELERVANFESVEQVFENACVILNSNRNIIEINKRDTEVRLLQLEGFKDDKILHFQISNSVLCDLCQMKLSKNDLASAKFDQLNLNEWRLWFFKVRFSRSLCVTVSGPTGF